MHNNNNSRQDKRPDDLSGRGQGMQGIDKAPGEETSQSTEQVLQETQKGKKVDADPSQPQDQPTEQGRY